VNSKLRAIFLNKVVKKIFFILITIAFRVVGQSVCNPTVTPNQIYYPNSTSTPTTGGWQYLCGPNTIVTDSIPNISCEWIYMNSGSTLTLKQQCISLHLIWIKSGGVLNILPGTAPVQVYYEAGATINDPSSAATLSACPQITFPNVNCTTRLERNMLDQVMVSIIPNPFTDSFKFQFPDNEGNLMIFNAVGVLVFSELHYLQGSEINLQHLKSGLYFCKIQCTQYASTLKIIKE
jgi:hypothetical protein